MKKIKIHFSRSTKKFNYFSRLLQWYEGIPVSHVLVEFDQPGLGQEFIYHSAVGNGVSLMTKERFESINEIMETYVIELSDEKYKQVRNDLLGECGEFYGVMQNIGIFFVDTARKAGIKTDNPFKKGQNCSELIYRHLISNIYKRHSILPDLVKPSQIRDILIKSGNTPIMSKINNYSTI
jgi:hypothetical protein